MPRKRFNIPRGLYLTWRARADGAVIFRWGMAPKLRAAGVKAFDLVDENGRPLDLAAAIDKARELTAAYKAGAAPAAPARRHGATIGDLLDAYLAPANLNALRNRATDKPLSDATRRSYRQWAPAIYEVFRDQPTTQLDHDLVTDWHRTMRATRGPHMAACAYNLLKIVWRWADPSWQCAPVQWHRVVAPGAPAKLRVGGDDELACLLRALDDPASLYEELRARGEPVPNDWIPARPEIGDSLVIALWTAQRARDVLAMSVDAFAGNRLRWIASKNNSGVDMPLLGPLPERIAAAKARRAAIDAAAPNMVINPATGRAYTARMHGEHFREARALAARFYPSLIGEGKDAWGRPCKPFTFEDCRDTAITRLHRAGCTLEEICSWSNHKSPQSLMSLIKAYIAIDGQTADAAGDKMTTWWQKSGGVV